MFALTNVECRLESSSIRSGVFLITHACQKKNKIYLERTRQGQSAVHLERQGRFDRTPVDEAEHSCFGLSNGPDLPHL